jgi:hypothetical protein
MPAITLESAFSLAAWLKLEKLRSSPLFSAVEELTVKLVLFPSTWANMVAAVLPKAAWVEGYSGMGGVGIKDVQAGSGSVLGLPSTLNCMALKGRQKL